MCAIPRWSNVQSILTLSICVVVLATVSAPSLAAESPTGVVVAQEKHGADELSHRPNPSLLLKRHPGPQSEENACSSTFWRGETGPSNITKTYCLGATGCNNNDVEEMVNKDLCNTGNCCNEHNDACSSNGKCVSEVRSSSLKADCRQLETKCDKRDDGAAGVGWHCVCKISIPKDTAVNCGCGCK